MDRARLVVFLDADDTLWENNLWFSRVLSEWSGFMERLGVARERALGELHACEDRNIPRTGYGAAPFVGSVREAFERLAAGAPAGARAEFEAFSRRAEASIRDHPIRLLPGVEQALPRLAAEARLIVLTKGQADEQVAKVERSGLAPHLEAVHVVPEKNPGAYREALERFRARPERTWMVGNSPRSDVNPARRAGLSAVLVPHPAPWHRELEPWDPGDPRIRLAETFADVPRLVLPPPVSG